VAGGRRHYAPDCRLARRRARSSRSRLSRRSRASWWLRAIRGHIESTCARACGSSNAAALTTRRAAQLIDRLRELQAEPGGTALIDARMAVILKAMLVHGASWDDRYDLFDRVFDGLDNGPERCWRIKRACAQFLGYGHADFDRGTVCTDQRVIVLGCGS